MSESLGRLLPEGNGYDRGAFLKRSHARRAAMLEAAGKALGVIVEGAFDPKANARHKEAEIPADIRKMFAEAAKAQAGNVIIDMAPEKDDEDVA